jgi:DNA-binding CsgD family transcriptional regulator
MFGGIWIGDSHLLPYLPASTSVVQMRLISLAMYSLMIVVAVLFSRRLPHAHDNRAPMRERLLLSAGILIGIATYLLGIVLIFQSSEMAFIGFALTKVIGAPLSIATVILAGRVERGSATTMISVGSLAAFLIFAVLEYIIADFAAAMVCSVGLLLFSSLSAYLGLTLSIPTTGPTEPLRSTPDEGAAGEEVSNKTAGNRSASSKSMLGKDAFIENTVITRPMRKILTKSFIAGLLLASIALGFARYSHSTIPGFNSLAMIIILSLLIGVTLVCRKIIRPSLFFQSALLCFSAGVLLSAIAPTTLQGLSGTLNGIGSALFETVVWLMMAWAVRNCSNQLLAATLSRFVVVVGHLFGTILVQAEFLSSDGLLPYPRLSALVLILFYFALVLLAISSPALRSLLLAISSDEPGPQTKEKREGDGSTPESYWSEPCMKVASSYGLTTRETEILCLLAKGRDTSFMEESLVLSRNTIKMHVRHIYQKLDVHSKQEVIDMIESARNAIDTS